jgi:hypothetical protein
MLVVKLVLRLTVICCSFYGAMLVTFWSLLSCHVNVKECLEFIFVVSAECGIAGIHVVCLKCWPKILAVE